MRGNPGLDLAYTCERAVPSQLQFRRDQPVLRIDGVVLAECPIGAVARRLEVAHQRITNLIAAAGRLCFGLDGRSYRSRFDNPQKSFLDGVVDTQSSECDAAGLAIVERTPRRVKKMKLLKGDSFPIFLVSDGVSQQSCRGHLSKEVARSSGCRRSVQRFRCSMAVFELLARATGAWVVAAGNGHLVNRSSCIADGVPRRSAAGKPVRMDVAGGWRYQVNQYLMSRVGVLVSLD